jgi:hypothetical protein
MYCIDPRLTEFWCRHRRGRSSPGRDNGTWRGADHLFSNRIRDARVRGAHDAIGNDRVLRCPDSATLTLRSATVRRPRIARPRSFIGVLSWSSWPPSQLRTPPGPTLGWRGRLPCSSTNRSHARGSLARFPRSHARQRRFVSGSMTSATSCGADTLALRPTGVRPGYREPRASSRPVCRAQRRRSVSVSLRRIAARVGCSSRGLRASAQALGASNAPSPSRTQTASRARRRSFAWASSTTATS